VSYLETGRLNDAKAHFNEIIQDGGPLADRAVWYLSLTYLLEENEQETIFWLERLAGNPQAKPYNLKASSLLKKLI
jgi:hypothetical protein